MRLIDADVAFCFLKDQKIKETGAFAMGVNKGLDIALRTIHNPDAIPTVDAVEVVRCKDCKHRCNGKDCTHPLLLSYSWGAIRHVRDNDFCSYGERRSDGGD